MLRVGPWSVSIPNPAQVAGLAGKGRTHPDPPNLVNRGVDSPSFADDRNGDGAPLIRLALKAQAPTNVDLPTADRDPRERLGEIQEKLELLLKRMQRAALLGDKGAVAALAREAAGLARDLAAAVREIAARSVAERMDPFGDPADLAGTTGVILQLEFKTPVDPGLILESSKALILLRTIIGLARGQGFKEGEEAETGFRKAVEHAEKAVEEAAASLEAMAGA